MTTTYSKVEFGRWCWSGLLLPHIYVIALGHEESMEDRQQNVWSPRVSDPELRIIILFLSSNHSANANNTWCKFHLPEKGKNLKLCLHIRSLKRFNEIHSAIFSSCRAPQYVEVVPERKFTWRLVVTAIYQSLKGQRAEHKISCPSFLFRLKNIGGILHCF